MSDIAIRVEGLSKKYRIGGPQARYKTLRESLVSAARAPIRRAGRLLRGEAATDRQETIWALKDVSFEVKHGEVLGIIGRNGAGKSTLLKVLSRITAPTEGTVDLYGRVGSLLEVGTGFHPELTGRENIYLNGAILGMKRAEIERKFDEIVDFSGVERFIETPVKHYSSGMYVRLAFAVAAHLEPEILVVDEVLAVGDAAFRKKCLGKMGDAARSGRTVLFVSHDMAQIRRLCLHALWLSEGRIAQTGDSTKISQAYESSTTYEMPETRGAFVRTGSHHPDIWISKVEMKDTAGSPRIEFGFGDEIVLDFHISYGEGFASNLNELAIAWSITDEGDVRISSDTMIHSGLSFRAGTSSVRCRINSIPLYRGTYRLWVWITQETAGRFDVWKDGVFFHVIQCAPYDYGYEFDRRSGSVHVGSTWETEDMVSHVEQATDGGASETRSSSASDARCR